MPFVLLLAACSDPEGSTPASGPASGLDGTWHAYSGPNTLTFEDSTWTLTTGTRVLSGKFALADDHVVFLLLAANNVVYDDYCRDELDVYTWSISADGLRLRPESSTSDRRVGGRPCDSLADQVFRNGPWTRMG